MIYPHKVRKRHLETFLAGIVAHGLSGAEQGLNRQRDCSVTPPQPKLPSLLAPVPGSVQPADLPGNPR